VQNQRLTQQIEFIIEIDKLKNILRQTLLTDSSRRENTAEHSWYIAMMAIVLSEYAPPETRQIIFHAKTNKIIVVLDKNDILELDKNGTLIQIIIRKIRDLFELSGLPTTSATDFYEIDLPIHLKSL
jgi:hypothetical protein